MLMGMFCYCPTVRAPVLIEGPVSVKIKRIGYEAGDRIPNNF